MTAGSRGSETWIGEIADRLRQDAECDQVGDGRQTRREVEVPDRRAEQAREDRGHRRRDGDGRRGTPVGRRPPDDQQVAGVGDRGEQADRDAELRVGPVGPRADDPRDQDDTQHHQRQRGEDLRARLLAEQGPRGERDDDDLQVAHQRAEPGPDHVHGVVERDQVDREADARGHAQGDGPAAHRAEGPPLAPRDDHEDRQAVHAPPEDACRWRHAGPHVEDPGERDGERPDDGRRPRVRDGDAERVHAGRAQRSRVAVRWNPSVSYRPSARGLRPLTDSVTVVAPASRRWPMPQRSSWRP